VYFDFVDQEEYGGNLATTGEGTPMKKLNRTSKLFLWGLIWTAGIAIFTNACLKTGKGNVGLVPTPDYWPTQGWQTSTPEEQGMDSAKLAEGLLAIRDSNLRIHSLLIIRNGRLLLDAYFYPYDGSSVHDLASVTKSITTTLIGIAIDQGKLTLDQPMLSFFPNITISNPDPQLKDITVRDLAMMANGLKSTGMAQDELTLAEMQASENWLQTAIDRQVVTKPGSTFVYDSPGMHILSGVLQNATGMTELEFARQNLFAPLGIKDVIWPADPQGYTTGFADLCLQPRDAAKIGFLWLNKGLWDGHQIISSKWVEEASKPLLKTGTNDDYGYGWWITQENGAVGTIAALGRGGQTIKIMPPLNVIVVTTGSGFSYDDVAPYLIAAFVSPNQPLPANPEAFARLNEAIHAIQQAPAPQPVPPLPVIAKSISGKTILFEPNPTQINSMRFDFDGTDEAKYLIIFADGQAPRSGAIGLDGVYRMSPGAYGLPAGVRGRWIDDSTLMIEYETIAKREAYLFVIKFNGDQVAMQFQERTHEAVIDINGTIQNP
jgi:CubicO group peptidase (beta-lactamase class C family)